MTVPVFAPWMFGVLAVGCDYWWLLEAVTGSCFFCSEAHLAMCELLSGRL